MQTDLLELKAHNFSNIGLRVSWGEIMTHWDPLIRKATYDEAMCTKLGAIAAASQAHGMKLIFNVHLADTVPQGIDGAYFVPSKGPDINNVTGGDGSGVWRSHYLDIVVRDTYIEPMLLFHTKFASCFEDHPTAPLFWKHSFESVRRQLRHHLWTISRAFLSPNTTPHGTRVGCAQSDADAAVLK